jgi:hypothetical protein
LKIELPANCWPVNKLPVYFKPDRKFSEIEFLKVEVMVMFVIALPLLFLPMPPSAKLLRAMPEHMPITSNILVTFFIGVNLLHKYIEKLLEFVNRPYFLLALF